MASEKYSNQGETTLNGSIDNLVTSLVVTSASLFPPSGQFRIRIDNEILLVTAVSGTTFTVTRGSEGTTAASHANGATVAQKLTAGAVTQIIADDVQYGASASRPSAEKAGRLYFANDSPVWHRDNGSSWDSFYKGLKLTYPTIGDFTETDGGNAATITTTTNSHHYLTVASGGTPDKLCLFLKAIPTAPYTVTAVFVPLCNPIQYTFAGMVLSDATKDIVYGWMYDTAHHQALWVGEYSTLTGYTADLLRVNTPCVINPMILRLSDDTTNVTFSYSNDGYNFLPVVVHARTNFLTATEIGMFIGTNCAATTNGVNSQAGMTWLSWTQT